MIDEVSLLDWLDSHKILAKTDCVLNPGRYSYMLSAVDLRREILRLAEEREVVAVDPEAETAT